MSRIAVDSTKHIDHRKQSEPTLDEYKNKNAQLQAMLMQMQTPEFMPYQNNNSQQNSYQ
jgi:hypothetical protein